MIDYVVFYYGSYPFYTSVCIIPSDGCTTPFRYLSNRPSSCRTRSSVKPRAHKAVTVEVLTTDLTLAWIYRCLSQHHENNLLLSSQITCYSKTNNLFRSHEKSRQSSGKQHSQGYLCCSFQLGAGQAQSNRSLPLTL